ncbi:uncharacterized protein [Musca autumnalis]|uniref:uncharacterized protein n=1 Tax=Musca autumnalis TaxID=221902 RepID=UPI003CE9AA98
MERRKLPNTPRINEKIREYCEKFGGDRNLEQFLRIYSPSTNSSGGSCEAIVAMANPLGGPVCKSMPNIHEKDKAVQFDSGASLKDILVDINIELEEGAMKLFSNSSENLHTPKKAGNGADIQQVKTPDSIAKTHRRLEWDSLGDIGYKKSMSTSNISVLERSLLKEFFKESSVTSEPTKLHEEKNDLENKPPQRKAENKQLESVKASVMEHATPPLACSTLVEGLSAKTNARGARPKMLTKSTSSTSLQEKFEKYAQTSLIKPAGAAATQSQEVQVSISSSTSAIEGTAPSSFEYYSSRSSKSRSSISSSAAAGTSSNLSNTSIPPTAQHPFITSITDLLRKRKAMNEKSMEKCNAEETINKLKSQFAAALEENKENQSHSNTMSSTTTSFSLTRQAPELDLGIQLICSLIDAKKVNEKQKKKLIRDIVKRITRMVPIDETAMEKTSILQTQNSTTSERSHQSHLYDAVYSRRGNGSLRSSNAPAKNERRVSKDKIEDMELGLKSLEGTATNKFHSHLTINSTSEHLQGVPAQRKYSREHPVKQHTSERVRNNQICDKGQQTNTLNLKPQSLPPTTTSNKNHKQVPIPEARKHSKDVQTELINDENKKERTQKTDIENLMLNIKTTRSTQTSNSPSSSTMSKRQQKTTTTRTSSSSESKDNRTTSTSSGTSHDLPTQKTVRKNITTYDTDGDQATMREWLNPLTQSEIEYEEKKREESKKKAAREALKREKSLKKTKQHNCGREKQLNWIESEIHRLECLKHLLLKDGHDNTSSLVGSTDQSSMAIKESFNSTQQTDKLYDTVYSDKSSVLSESAERLVKEIEVILEESSEDVFNDSSKCGGSIPANEIEVKINFQKSLERNERQALKDKPKPPQRQKIDTPPMATTDHSEVEGESLRDMVKQRKQEFMASYKTKKQNHYDILKQQQKVEARFKYLPPTRDTQSYYSVPHTMNRRFSPTEYAYPQSNLPPTPQEDTSNSSSSHVIYSTAAVTKPKSFQKRQEIPKPSTSDSRIAVTTTSAASSASIFCMSSDCSVPMGSKNVSSTPTTTHHYDDVAAAVAGVAAVQQSSELQQQVGGVIGEHHLQPYIRQCPPPITTFQSSIAKAAAIQVKPKGIAYVIEFDDTKELNNNVKKNNAKVEKTESTRTFTTNNLECLEKGPQLTLQEHLEKAKPNFLKHSKERKAILNQLQSMRQERDRQLREIVDNTSFNSLERRLKYLPPPPMQKLRILKTKEMKALTNKRVASLPEVVARKQQELEEKRRRGNRILRDVFNLRLQKRVRSGKLSLNHSKVVI